MGRGGGGGGGRSSGGSRGSRSSGGRSSAGHRGGGSFRPGSSRSSGSARRSYSPYRPYHSHYGSRPVFISGGGGGLSSIVASIIILAVILLIVFGATHGSSPSITRSTYAREPLPAGSVIETGYYTDELGWIKSASKLEAGMRDFYRETGVQPYLYITDTVNGTHTPSYDDMEAYAHTLYDQLFTDEAHVLLLFHEYNSNSNYSQHYVAGSQAKTVCDAEAMDILMDYIDHYYYSDLSEDELFSTAFEKAAARMMKVTHSPVLYIVIGLIALCILLVIFRFWKAAKKQKNLEAEQNERILNADLGETFARTAPPDDLERKYEAEQTPKN